MKQVEVTILGQGYILACPDDGEAALLSAVAMVDREMSAIRDAGRVKARERMAVLAALNLAYRLAEFEAQGRSGGSAAVAKKVPAEGGAEVQAQAPEPMDETSSAVIDALVRRLDDVLAQDGRLL